MAELWQLYDENGQPLSGQAASRTVVFSKGLLHGASHVWIWRTKNGTKEVLVQKRAMDKMTYPGLLDISAAGHIDADETPAQAAVREVYEEIGLRIPEVDLMFVNKHYHKDQPTPDFIEHEWKFIYVYELTNEVNFKLQDMEVESLSWKPLAQFKREILAEPLTGLYVYQGPGYFEALLLALGPN